MTTTIQAANRDAAVARLDASRYFLPYQLAAITDDARLVLWEKSIRIGATYCMAFRAVRNRMRGQGDYLHTSVNADIAKLFILDCRKFCELYDIVAAGEVSEIDEHGVYNPITDRQESAFSIYFGATKCAIRSFSSNPNALRGAGGDVGIDELTSHLQPEEMLKAAGGRAMWGYSIRIWTSHRGADSCFNRMLQEERAKGSKSRWKVVSTDLYQALDQGLLEKINQTRGTSMTREEFLADTIALVGGQEAFEEECLLKPRKGGTAAIKWQFLNLARQKYELVRFDLSGADGDKLEMVAAAIVEQLQDARADLGYDVARTGHLSALWCNRREGDKSRLVGLVKMSNMKFGDQRALIERVMSRCPAAIGGGDKTGLGMQVNEELEEKFGKARWIGMNFGQLKPELGTNLIRVFEDNRQILPEGGEHDDVVYDLAGIRSEATPSGRQMFYETPNPIDKRSHCDMGWACALANLAGKDDAMPQIY